MLKNSNCGPSDFDETATRKQEQWAPKVGEKCLVGRGGKWCETYIVGMNSRGNYVYESGDFSDYLYDSHTQDIFKPLPKHTEQELLAYELFRLMFEDDHHRLDAIKEFESYKNCLKIVESGRFK